MTKALLAIIAAAYFLPACATFSKAQQDVPGTVGVGLSVAACVTNAFQSQTDALARENAIYACVAGALSQLSEADKRELLAMPRKLDPSPYEAGK